MAKAGLAFEKFLTSIAPIDERIYIVEVINKLG